MPINVYTGLMRSGKSYEVVAEVIIPAIAAGRRVVTNVDGIDNDLIREYVSETRNLPIYGLGDVVHCTNGDVGKEDFFPYYDDQKNVVTNTFVKAGDLVCIDEAWRFWGTGSKILKPHLSFFLEHGHFTHPVTFVSCDLVLMIQDLGTLHRNLKAVVAFTFRTHKKVSLGMSNTYSVNMWEGSKTVKGGLIGSWVRKYNKAIFPLYSSFKGGVQGRVVNADSRQNILTNKKLWFMIALGLGGGYLAFTNIYKFFKPSTPAAAVAVDKKNPVSSSPAMASDFHREPEASGVSTTWRIVGKYSRGNLYSVVLSDGSGRVRLENPSNFKDDGLQMTGVVDGQTVSKWSGLLHENGSEMPEVPKVLK